MRHNYGTMVFENTCTWEYEGLNNANRSMNEWLERNRGGIKIATMSDHFVTSEAGTHTFVRTVYFELVY